MKFLIILALSISPIFLQAREIELFAEISELLMKKGAKNGVLDIYIYIKNKSDQELEFAVKPTRAAEGINVILITFGIKKTKGGALIKPNPRDINIINLLRNEIAEVYIYRMHVEDMNANFDFKIKYYIPKEFALFYSKMWTGEKVITVSSADYKKGKSRFSSQEEPADIIWLDRYLVPSLP